VTNIGIKLRIWQEKRRQPIVHAHAVGICNGWWLDHDAKAGSLTFLFGGTKKDITKDRRNHIEDHTDAEEQEEQSAVGGHGALRQALHSTHHVAGVELAFR